jgi:hypothetical protein
MALASATPPTPPLPNAVVEELVLQTNCPYLKGQSSSINQYPWFSTRKELSCATRTLWTLSFIMPHAFMQSGFKVPEGSLILSMELEDNHISVLIHNNYGLALGSTGSDRWKGISCVFNYTFPVFACFNVTSYFDDP